VDSNRFRPAPPARRSSIRRKLGLERWKVVLVVARLVPEKGFDRLLAAWSDVKAALPDALLAIVGDGCERAALESQASNLRDVRFIGDLRDPLPYFQAADCFTLPSYTEGQPISLLEAMSTGLVCVASNIGGISDALKDGEAGVLVPPGDVTLLAQALIHTLLLDEGDRIELVGVARQEILEHHSIQANAAALRDLYEQLI
jgi:glycosyltransferase involved in cell wall biosynthesis